MSDEAVMLELLLNENPDIILLQKSKREVCNYQFMRSIWSARNKEQVFCLMWGFAGYTKSSNSKILGTMEILLSSYANIKGSLRKTTA